MKRHDALIAGLIGLGGCGDQSDSPASMKAADATLAAPSSLSVSELNNICRATIASMMGHDISIIQIDDFEDGITYVSYARPSDDSVWKYRCYTDGSRVIWGSIDLYGPGTGPGIWRTRPEDEVITYQMSEGRVAITQKFDDGSELIRDYQIELAE